MRMKRFLSQRMKMGLGMILFEARELAKEPAKALTRRRLWAFQASAIRKMA